MVKKSMSKEKPGMHKMGGMMMKDAEMKSMMKDAPKKSKGKKK